MREVGGGRGEGAFRVGEWEDRIFISICKEGKRG